MKLLLVFSAVFAFGASRPSNPAFHEPILKLYSSLGNQGQYSYGYSGSSSSKSESRSADGLTQGSYSYIDGDGILQKVSYQADANNGFRVTATNLPVAPSGAAGSGANFNAVAHGSTTYGSAVGLGNVPSESLGRVTGDISFGSYSFSAPATDSVGGRFGSAKASYGASAGFGTKQATALGTGLGSGSISFKHGTGLGVEHGAGLNTHLGSGGSYSFSAPATSSSSQFTHKNTAGTGFIASAGTGFGASAGTPSLYGTPAFDDSSLLSGSPIPPRDTPEVSAAKARHFAAFEAAKINAATSVDDSAQHDDGQYRPNPSEDDGSYRDDGNALGSGFKGVEAYDDGQYRPNPHDDDGSYKGENTGLGTGFSAGFGAGYDAGAGFKSGAGLGSTVDAGKGAGAGVSPGGLPGVTGSGAGIGAGYGAGLGAGAKPGFKGLDAVSASGAGAGAGYGAGLGAQISQLGAAAGFGPFTASASVGPFGASFSAGRFGASVGSSGKTPASTQAGSGYGAHAYFAEAGSLGGVAKAGSNAFGGQFRTPASTQSSGYGDGARGNSVSTLGRYGSNVSGRFYSIPSSFPGFSQYYNQQGLGQYTYGYSADDQSSHQESRSSDGFTQGKYSYIDSNGILQTVKYISDAHGGFRVKATNLPIAPNA